MAIVVRYFSTSAAGAGDGTTWADRAALFSAGNWSTVITGFNFAGSDSLEARIGPGSYTCGQRLQASTFTNAPTVANPLILHGADSSGNRLAPPNTGWQSAESNWVTAASWTSSNWPVITNSSNLTTASVSAAYWRLINIVASGVTDRPAISAGNFDWCCIEASSGNSATFVTATNITNSVIAVSATAYQSALTANASGQHVFTNVRLQGVSGSSGNRYGFETSGTANNLSVFLNGCTIFGFGGAGFVDITTTTTSRLVGLTNCVIANNGGSGIVFGGTASQALVQRAARCMVTGNGGYGIDAQSAARVIASGNRLRDNTSGNFNGFGNYPTDIDNYVTDSDDATDYADAASYDFRTAKENAALWNKGYGMDEPNTAAGGVDLPDVMMVGA